MKFTGYIFVFLFAGINVFGQQMDLDTFLDLVRKNNKDIILANKELETAEENKREASSSAYPQLSAEGQYSRNFMEGFMFVDFPNSDGTSTNTKFKITYDNEFDFQAVLSQQIFNYTIFNAIKASKQYQKLSDFVYDATYQGIITGAKKAFYMTLLLKEVWNVNKDAEANAKDNYDLIKDKFDNGLASQFELLQAEVTWKNYLPETTTAERNYLIALNSIKILAAIPVEDDVELEGSIETGSSLPEHYDLETILTNRPDYNALIWQKNLLTTNIEVEKSGYFPNLYATLAYQYQSTANRWALDNENNFLVGGLTLSIPIFNGWGTSAKVQKAKIEVEKSEIQIDQAKDQIYKEISDINMKIEESRNRVNSAETTMETAKKAFEIATASASNGLATQLELKDARLAKNKAQLNLIKAHYDYLEAYFDWELATGSAK